MWDADGSEYLDLLGGIAVNLLGHAHPAVVEAVTGQVATLGHISNLCVTAPARRARRAAARPASAARRPGHLLQLRRRGQRGRLQDRPAHRPAEDRRRPGRFPRPHDGRARAHRAARQARAVRAAAGRCRVRARTATPRPCARRSTATPPRSSSSRSRARPASSRRRGLPGRRPRDHHRRRRAAGARRGADRHRPHRQLVRPPARRRRARRRHPGQGPRRRAADRRLPRHRPGRRRCSARASTAPPSAATRSAARPRSRCSTPSRRRAARPRRRRSARSWPRGIEGLGHPLVDHVGGAGLLLGVALDEPASAAGHRRRAARPGSLINGAVPGRAPAGAAAGAHRRAGRRLPRRAARRSSTPALGARPRRPTAPDARDPRHLLRDDDLSPAEQAEVLDLAAAMKADPFGHRPLEGPRAVAVDLRQALHAHPGVLRGRASPRSAGTPVIIDGRDAQFGRGETIADTARVLSRYVDAIVWRTGADERLEEMAADVPRPGGQRPDRRLPPVPGARRPADRRRAPRPHRRPHA